MATVADICNLALSRIGTRKLITDLGENSAEAKACSAVYEISRDAVLAAFEWKFATKRAVLALVEDAERDGWLYAYALPSDCVKDRSLYSGTRNPSPSQKVPYEIEGNDALDGQLLLTDLEDASLKYTAKVISTGLYSPTFVDALVWKIAEEVAYSVANKPALAGQMRQGYELALQRARVDSMTSRQPDPDPDSEFISVRT